MQGTTIKATYRSRKRQQDFIANHVTNPYVLLVSDYNYLVVADLQKLLKQYQDSAIYTQLYGGMDVTASLEEQLKLSDDFEEFANNFSHNLKIKTVWFMVEALTQYLNNAFSLEEFFINCFSYLSSFAS